MKSSPRQTMTAPIRRVRFVYVAMFFCFWAAAIGLRLFWLQVVRHSEFVERALKQQQRTFEVAPRRGVLYDRNLRELAMTVLVDSIYAVPSELGENRPADAAILSKIVHTDPLDHYTTEPADARALQRLAQLRLGRAQGHARDRRSRTRAQPQGHLLPERVQALLS